MEARIYNSAKKHFESIGFKVNKAQLQNAVHCICTFLMDEDLLIPIVIKALYPESEVKEVMNDNERKKKNKNEKEEAEKETIN